MEVRVDFKYVFSKDSTRTSLDELLGSILEDETKGEPFIPEILHISQETNGIETTTIEDVAQNERHKCIRFIKIPLVFNSNLYNPLALFALKVSQGTTI